MIGCFCHIHIHFAGSGAFPTGNTFALVHLHLKKGHPVHQGIKCSQRTKPFTEGAIEQYTQHKDYQQNGEFPCKKRAKCRPDAGIGNRQRDRPLQHTLRTEVFAEKRTTVDVNVIFNIALDVNGKQIDILQEIMAILADKDVMGQLVKADTPQDVMNILKKEG